MMTSSGILARQLVDELTRRAQGRTVIDPATREFLGREFESRLDHVPDPDRLYHQWQGNLDRYIDRALPRRLPGAAPVYVTEDMVRRQFSVCSEAMSDARKSGLAWELRFR